MNTVCAVRPLISYGVEGLRAASVSWPSCWVRLVPENSTSLMP